jgi:thymidylate kinase
VPARQRIPHPILVSFSGMDGAGKSTQIQRLCARLREARLRVVLITFWDDVARLKRIREVSGHTLFKGDKGVGSPEAPIQRRDKNVRSPLMTAVRLLLYFVDAVSLRSVVMKTRRSSVDIVVFDRYAYDELANLALGNSLSQAYVRWIMALVPRPHISFILDADPVQARARKPEYPLDFLRTVRRSYQTLSHIVGGMTILKPLPIAAVEQSIFSRVCQVLPELRGLREETLEEPSAACGQDVIDEQNAHPFAG